MRSERSNRVRRTNGAAMVEMSITLAVFMTLLLAIFEFALLLSSWSRGTEATRAGARLAVVSNPLTDLAELDASTDGSIQINCGEQDCGRIFANMAAVLPELERENVAVRYAYSDLGHPERPAELRILSISVSIEGLQHELVVPGILGLPLTISMPGFETARTSEDLYTPESD